MGSVCLIYIVIFHIVRYKQKFTMQITNGDKNLFLIIAFANFKSSAICKIVLKSTD